MPNTAPMRIAAGFTQHKPFQPLALLGVPDPLFYMRNHDDFCTWVPSRYTLTNTGNGSVAGADGDGGLVLLTTNTTTPLVTDISSMQSDNAAMVLDKAKKMAFIARIKLADALNPAVNVGKIQKTTTPFTVTDGIYLNKPTGSRLFTLNVVSGSTVQASFPIPAASFSAADGAWFDIGWEYDGKGGLLIFAGANLMGFQPEDNRNNGHVGRLDLSALTLSAANLCLTLALQSGTASSKTMNADFLYAAKER